MNPEVPMAEDVVDKIEHDHREVERLFAEFKSSPSRDRALQICDELEKHTRAEDAAVYPVFDQELTNEHDKIDEAEHEHQDARHLIGRVRNTTDESHLAELMNQLEQAVAHHVREEETEMLPKARRELPADELTDL